MPRKKPFSGKAKREQLKAKKASKQAVHEQGKSRDDRGGAWRQVRSADGTHPAKFAPAAAAERPDLLAARTPVSPDTPAVTEDVHGRPGSLPLLTRPAWQAGWNAEQLAAAEHNAFTRWLAQLEAGAASEGRELGVFERDIEFWRQFWRVLELSDMLIVVADIRHPMLHVPPALFHHVHDVLHRPFLLILNKCDLVPPDTVQAWHDHFTRLFPDIHIIVFRSFLPAEPGKNVRLFRRRQRYRDKQALKRLYEKLANMAAGLTDHPLAATAQTELLSLSQRVPKGGEGGKASESAASRRGRRVVLKKKRHQELTLAGDGDDGDDAGDCNDDDAGDGDGDGDAADINDDHCDGDDHGDGDDNDDVVDDDSDDDDDGDDDDAGRSGEDEHMPHVVDGEGNDGDHGGRPYLTIGLIGSPNTGKSTLVNALMARSVVSASRTPGHTRHFQTIYASQHVRLCDSPGMVFPSFAPRSLLVLSGLLPVAQCKEPYTVIRFLMQRLPLPQLLRLQPPADSDVQWSAWSLCDAYAVASGWLTAKAGRPDTYRAANAILRMAVNGDIVLSWQPPSLARDARGGACDGVLDDDSGDDDGDDGGDGGDDGGDGSDGSDSGDDDGDGGGDDAPSQGSQLLDEK